MEDFGLRAAEFTGRSAAHANTNSTDHSDVSYRPDIDGLRAIAVLSVVAFHAFPDVLKGGFIGVDVFFVISGFLISKIIFGSLEHDRFSILDFYSRRVRRIFPALCLVLASCVVAGWFVLLPGEFKQLGKHLVGGTTFVSNILLMRESGYFDTAAAAKPLLHLWSLGVEEQFYLFWPILLFLAWKRRFGFLLTTAAIAAASFIFNIAISTNAPAWDFYSPLSRFWELMIGGMLAWVNMHKPNSFDRVGNWLAPLGLLLILLALYLFNSKDFYPSWRALLPTLGTFFVIAAGPNTWLNKKLIGSKIPVAFGLVSYPLYLWHWPILTFARIAYGTNLLPSIALGAVAVSVLLASITFTFIEKPIRSARKSTFLVYALVALLVTVGATGTIVYKKDGFPFRMSDREAFTEYFDNTPPELKFSTRNDYPRWYRLDCDFFKFDDWRKGNMTRTPKNEIATSCYVRDPAKPHAVMLWGDSHAQQLYYGLAKELPPEWGILVGASSGCNPKIVLADSNDDYCIRSNWFSLQTATREKPDVVIVAQRSDDDFQTMKDLAARLRSVGVAKVIFAGPVPEWDASLPKIIVRDWWLHTPKRTFDHVDKQIIAENTKLKSLFDSARVGDYLDLIDFFCDSKGCLTYLGEDRMAGIITADYGHLTFPASDYLAKNLLVDAITKKTH
ncbi:acyltransferase family protein [Paraburkholderia caribensis]|uniref:acyltransferase family protein n=1 Tax=Paraburkholderia caribensis TaxID=75105 RepID=UPI0028542031|nr:acyltransferase family protein [Paraburkholderia caribensis]MDR6380069.1 peptidoglycan/LPS O-acetylase OafA/YrhL [Paraburkholderia caribensis]